MRMAPTNEPTALYKVSLFPGIAIFIYALLLIAATFKISSMPMPTFDPYIYSYLASGQDYDAFRKTPGLPPEWVAMPDQKIASSRPYYTVKPLHIALTRILAPVGGILRAPFLVSVIAFFSLGWVVWFWLRALGVTPLWRIAAAPLLMFSSVVTASARQGMPDMLCAMLTAAGTWLILSTRLSHAGALLLLTTIFARTDSLILGGLVLLVAAWRQRISVRAFAAWSLLMFVSEFLVARQGYPYRHWLAVNLGNHSYWNLLIHNVATTEIAIYAPFMLLALLAIKLRYQTDLILVCWMSWAIRYLLIPKLEVRFLLSQAVIIGVVAAASVLRTKNGYQPLPA